MIQKHLEGGELKQKDSDLICEEENRKDSCHYNFVGWNDGSCRRLAAPVTANLSNFIICSSDGERPITLDDIELIKIDHPEYFE